MHKLTLQSYLCSDFHPSVYTVCFGRTFHVTCQKWTPYIPEDLNRHVLSLSQENAVVLHSVGGVPSYIRDDSATGGNRIQTVGSSQRTPLPGLTKPPQPVTVVCSSLSAGLRM